MDRRKFGTWLAAALAGGAMAPAHAQRPLLKTYVGFPPGPGGFDNVARVVGEAMGASGLQMMVENRVGAGGRIALQALKADPNPETSLILSSQSPLTIFPHVYEDLRFDPLKDFVPLSKATTFDYALAVRADSPFRTIKDYLDWARRNSGAIMFGIPGNGTTPHFIAEAIFQQMGVAAQAVPYKGTAPAIQDLLGGQIPVHFDQIAAFIAQEKAGKLRVLATSGSARSTFVDAPTFTDVGIPITIDGWCGFYAGAGMSAAQQGQVAAALAEALRQPAVKDKLANMGMRPTPSTPAALREQQTQEYNFWGNSLKNSEFRKKVVG